MAADDLTAPLGREQTSKRRFALSIGMPQFFIGALSLSVVVFAVWAMIADDPLGGEPAVLVPTDLHAQSGAKSESPGSKAAAAAAADAGLTRYDGPDATQPAATRPAGR